MTTENWVIDLDGVLWLLDDPIPGSVEAVAMLLNAGVAVTFATNNSLLTKTQYQDKLDRIGVDSSRVNIISSSMAAATLVKPGEKVYVIGGDGLTEALSAVGVEVVESSNVDVVVVGWDRDINYSKLARATRALRSGARFIATNSDPIYPTPQGPLPGAGSIVAAVATAGGFPPIFAGKPEAAMANAVRAAIGQPTLMVGDRLETDGKFAQAMQCPFALVMSGIAVDHPTAQDKVDHLDQDLATLVKRLLA